MLIFCNVIEPHNKLDESKKNMTIDETIFIRIAENDRCAFEEFFRLTEKSLYAFTLSILKNHDDALDVVQETYLKIRGSAHLYKPMGKPMAWVFTIARNLAMNKLRLRSRMDVNLGEEIDNNLFFSYVTDHEDKVVLQSALKILSDQEREIILLHAISGYTHFEIAKYLDIPISTVLSKYHRGLKKLRKYLNQ